MRIFNKMGHTCYFSYAGSTRRGVNLKPNEQSPELPVERVNHPSMRNDLKRGRVGVLLSPTDKSALRGLVDEEMMAILEGQPKKAEKPQAPAAPLGKQMDARPPAVAAKQEEKTPDASYEAGTVPEKIDAVKVEIEARADMLSEEARKAELDKLASSEQPSVASAAEELKAEEAADDSADEDAEDESVEQADDEDVEDESVEQADDDPESKKAKTYRGIAKPKLLSMCLERELDARPDMQVKEMRELLIKDDEAKA